MPFCSSHCAYCTFLSHADLGQENQYIEALCQEITKIFEQGSINEGISTVYFGGGTPSLLSPYSIKKVIDTLSRSSFANDVEITLECNPEDLDDIKLSLWRSAGITRLSIGVQSSDDTVRAAVGRSLSFEEVIDRIILAKKYFNNFGVDLICGLPAETKESLLSGIDKIADLGVSHISLYDLEINRESKIARNPKKYKLLKDEESAEMLVSVWQRLSVLGYEQYEISNFAKQGLYCRHNLDFWHGKDYRGFGLGSVSRVGNKVLENTKDFEKYCNGENVKSTETLSKLELFSSEIMALMRLNEPLNLDLLLVAPNGLKEARAEKLIGVDNIVTIRGKLFNNYLVKKFVNNI